MNYLIIFEVEPKRRADVVDAVKAVGDWGELTATSYIVESERTVRSIIETLQPMMGPKDTVAVFTVSAPWAAHCDALVDTHALSMLGHEEEWIPRDWNGVDRS